MHMVSPLSLYVKASEVVGEVGVETEKGLRRLSAQYLPLITCRDTLSSEHLIGKGLVQVRRAGTPGFTSSLSVCHIEATVMQQELECYQND